MLLGDIVETSVAVAATAARTGKRAVIADALVAAGDDVELAVAFLTARPRQRRIGVSHRSLGTSPTPAGAATLTLRDVDSALSALEAVSGPGAVQARAELLHSLLARATEAEQAFLRRLIVGELRQGALDGVVVDAVATASGVPLDAIRRAAMLTGSVAATAGMAFSGGAAQIAAVTLTVGVPVQPMLAGSAPGAREAVAALGGGHEAPVWIDAKVDGVRAQIHRDGDEVMIVSRTLDDMTARLPEIVAEARRLPARRAILDGEVLAVDGDGRPRPFQDIGARVARRDGGGLSLVVFDILHLDGRDLIDVPLAERMSVLAKLAPQLVLPHIATPDPEVADDFFTEMVARGYEGVVAKRVDAPYAAGRRGSDWIKVKPVRTVDLVVLGVEWGSGRRRGSLSNIHLGARDEATGDFVMVGKTFKGMTDEMLGWQTERFLQLETAREGNVVWIRPEQVVEIAFDAVQRSRRYPGAVALRFARVLRYRDDKLAAEADTIASLRALAPGPVND